MNNPLLAQFVAEAADLLAEVDEAGAPLADALARA